MKKILIQALIILLQAFIPYSVCAGEYAFMTINVPGATSTVASCISGKKIVGWYKDAGNNQHGFLYNGKTYTTLDVPGAELTNASGISGKNIVGYYVTSGQIFHGFLATLTSSTSTPPTVTDFIVSSPAASRTISITTIAAISDVEITGYMVTTLSKAPSANSSEWSATPPTIFTFPSKIKSGTKTLHAWAKDGDGNVSKSLSTEVNLDL